MGSSSGRVLELPIAHRVLVMLRDPADEHSIPSSVFRVAARPSTPAWASEDPRGADRQECASPRARSILGAAPSTIARDTLRHRSDPPRSLDERYRACSTG